MGNVVINHVSDINNHKHVKKVRMTYRNKLLTIKFCMIDDNVYVPPIAIQNYVLNESIDNDDLMDMLYLLSMNILDASDAITDAIVKDYKNKQRV